VPPRHSEPPRLGEANPIDPATIASAVRILRSGGLVAFPTETVYGLGADADNPEAVARIFAAKGRPVGRPLTIHIGPGVSPQRWGIMDARARQLADRFWPGPLTLIVPRRPASGSSQGPSDAVTGGRDTVGIRMPSHPLAIALLDAFGGGVAAPSANRSGGLSPTTAEHVRDDLGDAVDLILDGGPCTVGIESTVLALTDGRAPLILRLGALARAELEAEIGPIRVQGQKDPHYRPRTPLFLERSPPSGNLGVVSFHHRPASFTGTWICAPQDPEAYARHQYFMLRKLDGGGHARIYVEPVPDDPAWETVASRLAEAAGTG